MIKSRHPRKPQPISVAAPTFFPATWVWAMLFLFVLLLASISRADALSQLTDPLSNPSSTASNTQLPQWISQHSFPDATSTLLLTGIALLLLLWGRNSLQKN